MALTINNTPKTLKSLARRGKKWAYKAHWDFIQKKMEEAASDGRTHFTSDFLTREEKAVLEAAGYVIKGDNVCWDKA
jgi:hypothetical protein